MMDKRLLALVPEALRHVLATVAWPLLAAGIVLGSWLGAAVCLSASVCSHMAVFFLAKHAKKQLNAIAASSPKMEKMLDTLSVRPAAGHQGRHALCWSQDAA